MDFRIADTFLASLARLTDDQQKQLKITVFDVQGNPANPGHEFHTLDRARDRNWKLQRLSMGDEPTARRAAAARLGA